MKRISAIAAALVALPLLAQSPAIDAAQAQYNLGRAAMEHNDAEKAAQCFEKAVALKPNVAEYHFRLGESYGAIAMKANPFKQMTMIPKVRGEFEKAVALDPNAIEPRFGLIDFFTMAPSIAGGDMDKALQQAAEIRKRDQFYGHRAYAIVYTRQKKLDLARKEWQACVAEQPKSARCHTALGTFIGVNDKRFRDGFAEIDAALQLDPNYMPAWFRLGQLAASSGANLQKGEEALQKYLTYKPAETEPGLANAHYFLGQIYEKQGKKMEARAAYGAALRLAPDSQTIKDALKRVS